MRPKTFRLHYRATGMDENEKRKQRRIRDGEKPTSEVYAEGNDNLDLTLQFDEANANLVSSQTNRPGVHRPVIDIDGDWLELVPSSTPGHFHLYVNKDMSWQQTTTLLRALTRADIVEKGYQDACLSRGMCLVRKPGEVKPDFSEELVNEVAEPSLVA